MKLPIFEFLYVLIGMLVYKFFGKYLEQAFKGLMGKPQTQAQRYQLPKQPTTPVPQQPQTKDTIICPHCKPPVKIPTSQYLDHLLNVHKINVEKWYEDLKRPKVM